MNQLDTIKLGLDEEKKQSRSVKDILYGLIKLARPKQWIKNLFLFAPIIFSRNIFSLDLVVKVLEAFLCFCLISSCVYIFNDIIDMEKDRNHPKKSGRPLPAGLIRKNEAVAMLAVAMPAAIASSFLIEQVFGIIVILYILNNLAYSLKIKSIVILDAISISAGFLPRVIGGASVIHVDVSPWILLCTFLLSLFLGFSKRRGELVLLNENADKHRETLNEYSIQFIDNMLSTVSSSTVIAYSLYTFSAHDNYYMMLTIPFVLFGIFRYQYLIYKKDMGGSPEETLLSDKTLIIDILLWISCSISILVFFNP